MSEYYFYKFCCLDVSVSDIYVGCTKNWRRRKTQHKANCHNPTTNLYQLKLYQFIRENGGWHNWNMILIAKHDCEDIREAHQYQDRYMRKLKATLNNKLAVTN